MANEVILKSEFLEYMAAFEQRMKVQFEDTRSLIRLSLEGLDALRESTDRGFADLRRENDQTHALLEAALKHVRQRVEAIEDRTSSTKATD
jgi:hypothetical protein